MDMHNNNLSIFVPFLNTKNQWCLDMINTTSSVWISLCKFEPLESNNNSSEMSEQSYLSAIHKWLEKVAPRVDKVSWKFNKLLSTQHKSINQSSYHMLFYADVLSSMWQPVLSTNGNDIEKYFRRWILGCFIMQKIPIIPEREVLVILNLKQFKINQNTNIKGQIIEKERQISTHINNH